MKYIFSLFFIVAVAVLGGLLYLYSEVRFDAYKIIDYKPRLSSKIYDRNEKLIANIFDGEHREYVKYEEIPARIIEALVAIEDTSYFEHKGINPEAIFRASIKVIKAMKFVEGGSTLTQQLIKNMVLTREKKIIRKLKEAVLAFKVESELSKEEILERYLNQVFFGHGYHGIKTAALGFFHKELDELSLKEICILVGLPQAPSAYDPTRHLSLALSRANSVLYRMKTLGWINDEEYKKAVTEQPLVYDETLTQNKAPYVVDQVLRETKGSFEDIKTGGYKIRLGIDLTLQNIAQESLKRGYENIIQHYKDKNETDLNGALIAMENKSGDILALVGGVDYEKSSYNRAVQSRRQPGSSFKPFIYQLALDLGYSPASKVADISRIYKDTVNNKEWKPKNYGGGFSGLVSLKDALVHSRNLATINLVNSLGLDTVHKAMISAGFENIPMDLSIALGSFGIAPIDYAKFFSAFPNGGEMVTPLLIKSIEDRFGNVHEYENKKESFTTPPQAYLMVDMMRSVVERGTGRRAMVKGLEVAGKTGTSNDYIDAWFCGYSPDIEVLVWYGKDNNKPMTRRDTGGGIAAPVFGDFMSTYLALYPQTTRKFKKPEGVYESIVNDKTVYFTESSPLPKASYKANMQSSNELIF